MRMNLRLFHACLTQGVARDWKQELARVSLTDGALSSNALPDLQANCLPVACTTQTNPHISSVRDSG
jgi:hypothetical protein